MEKNIFNVNDYFSLNYGLGRKPKMPHFKKAPIVIGIALIILAIVLAIVLGGDKKEETYEDAHNSSSYEEIYDNSNNSNNNFWIIPLIIGAIVLAGPAIKFSLAKAKAIAWQNNYNQRRSTWDVELDSLYQTTVEEMNLKQVAMKKIGVVQEQLSGVTPFDIAGSLYDEAWRKGVDGRFRTSKHQISWLFFSEDQIFLYTVTFSLLNKKKIVNTFELFYKDIVSISITTETESRSGEKTGDEGSEVIENQEFNLIVPGDKMHFAFTPDEETNDSILGMRTRIREKKNAEEKKDGEEKKGHEEFAA